MKNSYLISLALVVAVSVWMAAGQFGRGSTHVDAAVGTASDPAGAPMSVSVRDQQAADVERHITAQGQVEPNRWVTVRAETAGRIADVVAAEGRAVKANAVLARIAADDRPVRLKQAETRLAERARAHERMEQMAAKGFQPKNLVEETLSALMTAEADLEAVRLDITKTAVRAPFDGILEVRQVELGDYVDVNGEVATIVDNDPLVVSVQIAQQDIGHMALGRVVDVTFATGGQSTGVVRYVAPRAEQATRTFRVEIAVPNPDNRIPSGTSAEARIPTGAVSAQFVSSALLGLDDDGVIGVKTVGAGNVVNFHPVTIVKAGQNGVWVSGLPATARVIAVGHGFVRDGQTVQVTSAAHDPVRPDDPGDASLARMTADDPDAPRTR